MSIPIPGFWTLLRDSRLLAPEQCQRLAADFAKVKGAGEQSNSRTLAEWLVARNVLSRYQTLILCAGRTGPFFYGDYKIYDRVEKGRHAGWFRALHGPTGHPVLLQFLTGEAIHNPTTWAEAVHNTLSACTVQSPHVQRYFEPVDLTTYRFVVSEDLQGVTLDDRLGMGRYPPAEACRLARMAAIGLAQLHQTGRPHGDVRPANLFLDTSVPGHPGDLKVLFEPHVVPGPIDFTQGETPKLVAMADYLAPELMHAGHVPDAVTDVYSLGCTLYHMLSGNPPFAGGTVMQKMSRHASEGIRPLEPLGVPPPLAQLVTYMLAKNPQVRYQSPAIVAEHLAPYIDPAQLYAPAPQPLPTQAAYEHSVQQRQAAIAAAAQPQPAQLGVGPAGSGKPADGIPGVALNTAANAPGPARFVTPAPKKGGINQSHLVLGGLVALGVVVISLLFVVMSMKNDDPKPGPAVAVKTPDQPAQTSLEELKRQAELKKKNEVPVKPVNNLPNQGTNNSGNSTTKPPVIPGKTPTPPAGGQEEGQQIVPDDGQLLWASPTAGTTAVDLKFVPPEGNIFYIVRPAEMLRNPEGSKVLEALGPQFTAGKTAWEEAAGVKLAEIDQLVITMHSNEGKFPRLSYVVHSKDKLNLKDLLMRWGNPTPGKEGDKTIYQGQAYAYYPQVAEDGTKQFVMGEANDIKEVAKADGAPPLLARDMVRLLKSIDGDRHFNLLFNPGYFDSDGDQLFKGTYAKLRQPIKSLLGEELAAGLVSMHFGPAFYLEARLQGQLNKDRQTMVGDFRTRLNQLPDSIEQLLITVDAPAYWKKVHNRYRGMIVDLQSAIRVGVEGDQAVINAYLPGNAAHNLVLGGELLVSSTPGASAGPTTAVGPTAPKGPQTIDEVLALKTKMEFAAQSLEFVMADVVKDAHEIARGSAFGAGGPQEFAIKILGEDLQLDGITRNQTVRDFNKAGTLAEVLTAIVVTANSKKPPDDPDQKLIWVISSDPENPAKKMILITTKAAAAKKKYTVPAVFQKK
ncbi:serine/threonine protein kinase [Anatilimnocola floriformis]|uniref:serine/threonine protein kinase n=1 Tax=Anatilimnocola floriformis TaxID=2948575 RepID=UPI0020C2D4C3|nr:protein kinase [Anatilimnocola floriformis]